MQYDGSIRINTLIDAKNASSQMMGLVNQIQKASDKVNSLRAKMDALKDAQIPTQQYKEIESDIAKAEKELQKLIEKQSQMKNEGKDSGSAWDLLNQKIQAAKDYISYAQEEMQQLVYSAKAFTLGQGTQEYANLGQQLGYAENDLARLNRRYDELNAKQNRVPEQFKKMRASAKKAFDAVSSGAKKSDVSLSKGFKTILKYGFGIRSLYVLFNKIRSGITEGFKNLMGYSDSFANSVQSVKNSMGTLGNQIAAAFSPLVQMVIPWLNSLINALTKAISYVSQFFAILGGKSTFTRAVQIQDKYNKALSGTAAAAKKAYGALAKFDDLDVLQKQDDAGGGGAAETLPKDMFEEVPVDKKALSWLDGILERLRELKGIFMQGFFDGFGDWEYRLESIKKNLQTIKNVILGIITDTEVLKAVGESIESVVKMIGTVIGSIASIILTIIDAVTGGIAKFLEQNEERIKQFIISVSNIVTAISDLVSKAAIAIAYVFEAFSSEQGQQLIANILGIINAVTGVVEIVLKIFRDLLNIVILPFIENADKLKTALEGLLGFLSNMLGTIKKGLDDTFAKLNEIYDAHFKPFFDSVAQGLSNLVGKFLEFWNGSVQPILDSWAAKFDEVWQTHLQPAINGFIELLGSVADLLLTLWENVLQPFISWVIENILPPVVTVIDGIISTIINLVGVAADVVSAVIQSFKAIIEFFTGLFKTDFDSAWATLVEDMRGIGGNLIEGLKNGILGAWESLKETVGGVASSVLNKFRDVFDIHSPSAAMDEDGTYLMEGLYNGIERNTFGITELFNLLSTSIVEILTSLNESVFVLMEEMGTHILEQWNQTLRDTQMSWEEISNLIKTSLLAINTNIVTSMTLANTNWAAKWAQMLQKVKEICAQIVGAVSAMNSQVQSMCAAMIAAINAVKSAASSLGSVGGGFRGAGGGGARIAAPAMARMADVPQLASGAVIRGGNPFMAILGDQPRGQVNVETPANLIKDMVTQGIAEAGIGSRDNIPVNINIIYDGETTARVMIPDILSELGRQGYNVEVLGVT